MEDFNFGNFIWTTILIFFFVSFLFVLFWIFADIFRDHDLSGWGKALWSILLVFLPILGSLAYLIVRGDGMARRSSRYAEEQQASQERYIRSVATTSSPVDQLAQAKALLDSGAITRQEYEALKVKVLA